MDVPLSPRAFRLLDGASKLVGLLAIAAALSGAAAPHSLLVGVLGVGVGVATVFLSPRTSPGDGRDASTPADADGFRPFTRLARRLRHSLLALVGGALWLLAFLVAGAGVLLRGVGAFGAAATLFALSGPLGLLGVLAVVAAAAWEAVAARRA